MNSQSLRVLHIEDDEMIRAICKLRIEKSNHKVSAAESPNEIKDISGFDVIVMDLNYSGATKDDVRGFIERFSPKIPIIFLSGSEYDDLPKNLIVLDGSIPDEQVKGNFIFLKKPIDNFNLLIRALNLAVSNFKGSIDLDQRILSPDRHLESPLLDLGIGARSSLKDLVHARFYAAGLHDMLSDGTLHPKRSFRSCPKSKRPIRRRAFV